MLYTAVGHCEGVIKRIEASWGARGMPSDGGRGVGINVQIDHHTPGRGGDIGEHARRWAPGDGRGRELCAQKEWRCACSAATSALA
ncbi:hypothetical protein HYPSUDRAFT_280158 [Hypholoma sublateritium FD-334 SS-4]|uniref:Uncharacterized protein n=1 Tax=Hypholoma sublateritium (strain FD-334 SS-4) TaxID=945553 RepID=A0A0D2Q4W8_HYPSF|nr:hypothetical protein HYPSUDRAFT_280158 [Hypholoma sublateritium FD-334 SS-4]